MTTATFTRHTAEARDGSRLTAVRREDGRVELSMAQAPDRAVSVVWSPEQVADLAAFLTDS